MHHFYGSGYGDSVNVDAPCHTSEMSRMFKCKTSASNKKVSPFYAPIPILKKAIMGGSASVKFECSVPFFLHAVR